MEQKEIIHHLKTRWRAIHRIEVAELRKKPLAEKLNQVSATFKLGKLLNMSSEKKEADVKAARKRWRQLKTFSHGKRQNKTSVVRP